MEKTRQRNGRHRAPENTGALQFLAGYSVKSAGGLLGRMVRFPGMDRWMVGGEAGSQLDAAEWSKGRVCRYVSVIRMVTEYIY